MPIRDVRLEASFNASLSLEGESALVYILERAIDEGAVGLSVSTHQVPAVLGWLDTNEIIPLLKVLHKKEGILSVDVGNSKNIVKDIEKAILLAKSYGLKLHISRMNIQKEETLDRVISSLDRGGKELPAILVDVSPHSGKLLRFTDFLPSNLRGLSGEELRIKLRRSDILKKKFEDDNMPEEEIDSSKLVSTSRRDMKKHEGSRLIDIALESDESVYDVLLKFLEFDSETTFLEYQNTSDDVLRKTFMQSNVLPATSGFVRGRAVPEMFSSVPLYFNEFAQKDVLSVLYKLCELPSKFYELKWGIARGLLANFILIDPDNFTYSFDYNLPKDLPKGVEFAVVNGKIVMENNNVTSFRSGRILSWI